MDSLDIVIDFLKKTDELHIATLLLSVFQKQAGTIYQFDQLGRLFHDVKSYKNSIDCTNEVIRRSFNSDQLFAAKSNLAKLYNHTNNPLAALSLIDELLDQYPDNYELKMERVFSLYLNAKFDDSVKLMHCLIEDTHAPKDVHDRCKFNLGSHYMDSGEYMRGLTDFITVGHEIGIWKKTDLPRPLWDGKTHPGLTVAILAEGGIGDEVINIRFCKVIEERGMIPLFVTNREETRVLFSRNGFNVVTYPQIPDNAVCILSMFLPIILNICPSQYWHGPYLTPSSTYVEKWRKLLPSGKLVAIKWSGNPYYEQDLHRSLDLHQINEVVNFSRNDITFVSVQKEHAEQLSSFPMIFDAAPYLETLEDLLACLSLMQNTISSCTSVAHIAAAAGLPVNVLPPIAAYYVWLGDSKWYGDNCRVLRQCKLKDWSHLYDIQI